MLVKCNTRPVNSIMKKEKVNGRVAKSSLRNRFLNQSANVVMTAQIKRTPSPVLCHDNLLFMLKFKGKGEKQSFSSFSKLDF